MLQIALYFDEEQYNAGLSIAAKKRRAAVQEGMRIVAEHLAYAAWQRCPRDSGDLEKDWNIAYTGRGWGAQLGTLWGDSAFNFKVVWGKNTNYSKTMDEFLEVGISQYSWDVVSDKKRRRPWSEDPTYRLRSKSVKKQMQNPNNIKVGGRFLQRAYKDTKEEMVRMQDQVFANANRIIARDINPTNRKRTKFARTSGGSIAYPTNSDAAALNKKRQKHKKMKK